VAADDRAQPGPPQRPRDRPAAREESRPLAATRRVKSSNWRADAARSTGARDPLCLPDHPAARGHRGRLAGHPRHVRRVATPRCGHSVDRGRPGDAVLPDGWRERSLGSRPREPVANSVIAFLVARSLRYRLRRADGGPPPPLEAGEHAWLQWILVGNCTQQHAQPASRGRVVSKRTALGRKHRRAPTQRFCWSGPFLAWHARPDSNRRYRLERAAPVHRIHAGQKRYGPLRRCDFGTNEARLNHARKPSLSAVYRPRTASP